MSDMCDHHQEQLVRMSRSVRAPGCQAEGNHPVAGAMAEVQHLASILAVGGSAHCPVHVNLPCSSDEAAPLVPLEADLTLRLLSISLPPSGTPATSSALRFAAESGLRWPDQVP